MWFKKKREKINAYDMSTSTVRSIFVPMLRKFFNLKSDSEDMDVGVDNSTTGFTNILAHRKEGNTEESRTSNCQIEKSKRITYSKFGSSPDVEEDERRLYTLLPGQLDLMDE